ncbi:NUDIX hydrolase [Pseudomarimonas salicorniae]|uniref:NUDIX hydrolase n=1 Tax=Pseudomarimonas salicorniae TaxID=2933270 RepID=A0ABT0GLJ9_9GAMM|nr:NUDIX hydrolase [Lysobacter sp. CAU 1642]MCK7595418.1 NUDIX hydrolase [Lysobacter sp. CAU 1642]
MPHAPFDLQAALEDFARRWPTRRPEVDLFLEFLQGEGAVFERSHLVGHFTGSAWIVDPSGQRSLLTLHAKLGRWLQLGGHADGDPDLRAVALREAEEESGLTGLSVEPAIFDIDRHAIPARGAEPEHWHYDVRFVVRAGASTDFVVSEESSALAWREVAELVDEDSLDPSLRRMARQWLTRDRADAAD